ncbi:MAG: hypothetical protein WCG05_05695, partial [Alphaproteobacteria bacterium]
ANFNVINYTINTSPNPTNGGSISGGGQIACGSNCTILATANAGYQFTNWIENGNIVSTSNSYSFIVNGNRNIIQCRLV